MQKTVSYTQIIIDSAIRKRNFYVTAHDNVSDANECVHNKMRTRLNFIM